MLRCRKSLLVLCHLFLLPVEFVPLLLLQQISFCCKCRKIYTQAFCICYSLNHTSYFITIIYFSNEIENNFLLFLLYSNFYWLVYLVFSQIIIFFNRFSIYFRRLFFPMASNAMDFYLALDELLFDWKVLVLTMCVSFFSFHILRFDQMV